MDYAVYDTEIGKIKIGYEDKYIVLIERDNNEKHMGNKNELTDNVFNQIEEYLYGKRKTFDFPYKVEGSEFQKKVWEALLSIPYGETRTYKDIAILIGNEKASRAVGMANNKNQISIAIPCHRVIGSSGRLVGYASGLDMKEHLLELEKKYK